MQGKFYHKLTRSLFAVSCILWAVLIVQAHPNDTTSHSMRSLVRMADQGLKVMVLLEVPIMQVLGEFEEMFVKPGQVGPEGVQPEQIGEFNKIQWERLIRGLTITVNGTVPEGTWLPVDNPINGKANASFFVYMVWYQLDQPDAVFAPEVVVEVENQAFLDEAMFLSGYADSKGSWQVTHNSAAALLEDGAVNADANTNPASWTQDPAMRKLKVVFAPTTAD
jgi:hypothetical protein